MRYDDLFCDFQSLTFSDWQVVENAAYFRYDRGTVDTEGNWRRVFMGKPSQAPPVQLQFQGRMESEVFSFISSFPYSLYL